MLLFNTNNSIQLHSFICIQLNGSQYFYQTWIVLFRINHWLAHTWIASSIAKTNNLICTQVKWFQALRIRGKVDLGVMVIKEIVHLPQSYRTWASPLDGFVLYPGYSLGKIISNLVFIYFFIISYTYDIHISDISVLVRKSGNIWICAQWISMSCISDCPFGVYCLWRVYVFNFYCWGCVLKLCDVIYLL